MSYKQTPLKDREGNMLLPETITAAVTDPALGKTQAEINAETITRVELVCDDDQHITLIDDPTPLTYSQVKALVDDTTKFVTLRYLDMWWMLPSYDDGGAIMFTSSDIQGGHVMVTRVILNDDGQMNNYSIVAEDAEHKTDDMSVETASDGHRTYPTTHAVNGALATKANTDGYYTELTSGMSEQLLSPDGITDEEPYIYRTSAGSTSISTGVAEIKSLYGNSIVWNQISNNTPTTSSIGLTFTRDSNNVIHINGTAPDFYFNLGGSYITMMNNLTVGKYLLTCNIINNPDNINLLIKALNSRYSISTAVLDSTKTYYYICEVTPTSITMGHSFGMADFGGTGTLFNDVQIQISFHNLTQMFGEGKEPTLEQFKQWFPNDYYEYNAGEIINVNVDGLKTVGFNAYNNGTANVIANSQYQITGAYTSVKYSDGTDVVIEGGLFTPTKNDTIAIAGGGTDTCVHLVWSGYRNGDYEPYQEHNISIPVKEIKDANGNLLFPNGLLSAGSVKDEVTSDKAIKRCNKENLKNVYWRIYTLEGVRYFYARPSSEYRSFLDVHTTVNCINYPLSTESLPQNGSFSNDSSYMGEGFNFIVRDDSITTVAELKNKIVGDYTFAYVTPIEVEFKEVPQVFGDKLNLTYFVDDFGTEEFTTDSTEPTAPVKHSTFYMTNLRDKIRNIDGNTDSGALMNGSVDNLLTTLGTALGGTLTKTWDATNKRWTFAFTPNATTLNEEGGEQ